MCAALAARTSPPTSRSSPRCMCVCVLLPACAGACVLPCAWLSYEVRVQGNEHVAVAAVVAINQSKSSKRPSLRTCIARVALVVHAHLPLSTLNATQNSRFKGGAGEPTCSTKCMRLFLSVRERVLRPDLSMLAVREAICLLAQSFLLSRCLRKSLAMHCRANTRPGVRQRYHHDRLIPPHSFHRVNVEAGRAEERLLITGMPNNKM